MKRDTDKKIIFRRIRGRIVPIKISSDQYRGAAETAAGVGIAAAGGGAGSWLINRGNRTVRRAGQMRTVGRDLVKIGKAEQLIFGENTKSRHEKKMKGFRMQKKANQVAKLGRRLRFGGIGLGIASILAAESVIEKGVERISGNNEPGYAQDIGQNVLSGSLAAGAAVLGGRKTVGAKKLMRILKQRKL